MNNSTKGKMIRCHFHSEKNRASFPFLQTLYNQIGSSSLFSLFTLHVLIVFFSLPSFYYFLIIIIIL